MYKVSNKEEDAFITTSPWLKLSGADRPNLRKKMDSYTNLAIEKTFSKGSCLINAGDVLGGVYYLKDGTVQVSLVGKNGLEKILTLSSEDYFLGEEILFHHQPALYSAFALTDVRVYLFPKHTFLNILRNDFEVAHCIMYGMAIRVRVLANQIEDLLFRSTFEKVVRTLFYYSVMENNDNFAISHKNLATIVGAHRVSITNVIAELKEAGIVETQYGKIIIKDKIALKELVFQNL